MWTIIGINIWKGKLAAMMRKKKYERSKRKVQELQIIKACSKKWKHKTMALISDYSWLFLISLDKYKKPALSRSVLLNIFYVNVLLMKIIWGNQGLLIMTAPVGWHTPEINSKLGLHLLQWRLMLIWSQF